MNSFFRREYWLYALSAAVCSLAVAPGCRRSETVSVAGQVTLDGTALPTGTIVMIPKDTAGGPSVGGKIIDGHYDITADKGPRRNGKYRVEIRSVDPASASMTDPLAGTFPVFRDRVPNAYNSESKLELSIPPDAADLQHDFQLKSGKKGVP